MEKKKISIKISVIILFFLFAFILSPAVPVSTGSTVAFVMSLVSSSGGSHYFQTTDAFAGDPPVPLAQGVSLNESANCNGEASLDITFTAVNPHREFGQTSLRSGTITGSFEQDTGFQNYSGTFFHYGIYFDPPQPADTLIGSYAYVGETPPGLTDTLEFFILFNCTNRHILFSCYGSYGTCPQTADQSPLYNSKILWHNQENGDTVAWFMQNATRQSQAVIGNVGAIWKIVGTGDFNNDGKSDILWQNLTTGDIYVWYMDGATMMGGEAAGKVEDLDWRIAAVADFNNDGHPDYLWQHQVRGDLYVWFIGFDTWWNALIVTGGSSGGGIADTNWKIVGADDFNDDGLPDYLWQHQVTGDLYVWFMDGTTATGGVPLSGKGGPNWKIAGTGYFNIDRKPDILWHNQSTGDMLVWFMDGVTQAGESSLSPESSVADTNWKIESCWH